MSEEPLIAVFVDYENLAIGARDSRWRHLNIDLILKRLLEKGRIVYKRAYCDWSQYRSDVEMPPLRVPGADRQVLIVHENCNQAFF